MRTTVTLDADVEQLVREAMATGRSFKQVLNEAARRGLRGAPSGGESTFEVVARPMILRRGIDPLRLRELDDELEVDEFRRKTQRLEAAAG